MAQLIVEFPYDFLTSLTLNHYKHVASQHA